MNRLHSNSLLSLLLLCYAALFMLSVAMVKRDIRAPLTEFVEPPFWNRPFDCFCNVSCGGKTKQRLTWGSGRSCWRIGNWSSLQRTERSTTTLLEGLLYQRQSRPKAKVHCLWSYAVNEGVIIRTENLVKEKVGNPDVKQNKKTQHVCLQVIWPEQAHRPVKGNREWCFSRLNLCNSVFKLNNK